MSSYSCTQLWHNGSGGAWFKDITIKTNELAPGELLIKSLYSYISCGTERTLISNPPQDETLAEQMKVPYMEGNFRNEFTYGYSLVGEVIEGSNEWIGKIVHVLCADEFHDMQRC